MKFPSIKAVRSELFLEWKNLRKFFDPQDLLDPWEKDAEPATEVRLNVQKDGSWRIVTGLGDYISDWRGLWGFSYLAYGRQNLEDLAKGLLEEVKERWWADSREEIF